MLFLLCYFRNSEKTPIVVQKNASSPRWTPRIQVWSSNQTDRFWDVRKAQGQPATVSRATPRDDVIDVCAEGLQELHWEKLSHVEPVVCRSKFSPMKWLEWLKWPACESWLPRAKRSESVAIWTWLSWFRKVPCEHWGAHIFPNSAITPNSPWIEMPQFLAGGRAHRPTDVLQFQRSSTSM